MLFLDYLEGIPAATLGRIYTDTRSCVAIYGLLPALAQYTIRRLLLVKGPTPFEELRSWHLASFKPQQNPALLRMKQLQILQGKEGKVFLHPEFQQSLIRAFSGDFELEPAQMVPEGVAQWGEQRWNSLLFMLVTGSVADAQTLGHERHLKDVLLGAGLATAGASAGLSITNKGFQFLLEERALQLWMLLVQYFVMAEATGADVVECIISACRLALCRPGVPVGTSVSPLIMGFFQELGLVWKRERPVEYFATDLVPSLRSYGAGGEQRSAGHVIVETNYQVYAYTSAPLDIAILGLFVKLKDHFGNMVHGQLTGPSVGAALAKGITADQIIAYLRAHLRPTALGQAPAALPSAGYGVPGGLPPVIEDQIHLWERDRNRLRTAEGYMYHQFLQEAEFQRSVEEAQRLKAALYVNYQRRILIIRPEAHASLKAFIKTSQHHG